MFEIFFKVNDFWKIYLMSFTFSYFLQARGQVPVQSPKPQKPKKGKEEFGLWASH